jgi:NDP-sugar pyrophosphorylase family protein
MQAVILAAGRGTRMTELTTAIPKPMLDVGGKTLLEHKFDALPEEIHEVILIVGYLGSVIHNRFGGIYGDKNLLYVEQEDLNGTAGALWCARDVLDDRFLVMMGDDIYMQEDILQCIAPGDAWRLLVQQYAEMHRAGDVHLGPDGNIEAIVEGDRNKEPGIASTNMYFLDTRLFSCPLVPKQPGSLEFGLPQTVVNASKTLGIRFEPVFTDKWVQITSPKDLVMAAEVLKKASS